MIAKAKAIAHGKVAIEYIMRENKLGELLASNLIQNITPDEIYLEFADIQKYNTRCKNKFIRVEIGIAPQDEAKLSQDDLRRICYDFSKHMGFDNHLWVACTHKDTDNKHIHMIVSRISIDQSVYDTSFISNKASNIAEKISMDMGLAIANQVNAAYKQRNDIISFERMIARTRIEREARNALSDKPKNLREFQRAMKEKGIIVSEVKNKKGNTYGLRFIGYGEIFKASSIGQEYGYRTMLQTFRANQTEERSQTLEKSEQDYNSPKSSSTIKNVSVIGSLLDIMANDSEAIQNDDKEQNNKQNKKRKYGR